MKKLVKGILEFRSKVLPSYLETFAQLALGQKPDALYIGCSDSRVAVNVFASTDPGDLFVNRNVGNMIPPFLHEGKIFDGVTAAIEYAVQTLNVRNVIVCGHSECGAMLALVNGIESIGSPGLKSWLSHGQGLLEAKEMSVQTAPGLAVHNRLSQLNVLKQMEHLNSYPLVQERVRSGKLQIHGWWFEISRAEVYTYDRSVNRFVLIDEAQGAKILNQI